LSHISAIVFKSSLFSELPPSSFLVIYFLTPVTPSEYKVDRAFLGPVGIFNGLSISLEALEGVAGA
jgi:hypothetical protein